MLPYPENAGLTKPKPPTPDEAATILGDFIISEMGDKINGGDYDPLYGVLIKFFKGEKN